MACDPGIAKLLSHIARCHSANLPGERLRFSIGDQHVGYVQPALAARLAALSPEVAVTDAVALAPRAAGEINALARAAGLRIRHEDFDVRAAVEGPVLAVLDRGALPDFGVIGVGVHLNGLVRRPDGWHLWVAKRAADKKLDPGKLDQLVAGGVAAGMTPLQTLEKEGAEEASLPAELVRQARQVARLSYAMEREEGLRRDVIFAYDLILPEDFTPRPNDDEVEYFELWPLARVVAVASTTDDFKFNVNLVLIDLFIRLGMIADADAAALRAALFG